MSFYSWMRMACTVSNLLGQIAYHTNYREQGKEVMTIHDAKGQEAECVLVLAETEKQLSKWLGRNEDSEEERVGYVAFTRARKILCIWAPNLSSSAYTTLNEHVDFINPHIQMK